MEQIIPKSEQMKALLNKSLPSYRLAYSDRTAWLMAMLSELAYLKFNPLFKNNNKKLFSSNITLIKRLLDDSSKKSLEELANKLAYDHDAEKEELEKKLKDFDIELIQTFDKKGTQAILVSFKSDSKEYIALAFRGTEANSIIDIKADCTANITECETGGKIHAGFSEAFAVVADEIQAKIDEEVYKESPLLITGHSLGGALATIAAKKLNHQGGIAACYTFGAPRVGNEDWISSFKSPVYRVVNAADCVTMLPPKDTIITIFSWLLRFLLSFNIPFLPKKILASIQSSLKNFAGYLHNGDMRYLTDCKKDKYDDVKLLPAVSFFRRLKALLITVSSQQVFRWRKFLNDHSIKIYRKKLCVIALRRNKYK